LGGGGASRMRPVSATAKSGPLYLFSFMTADIKSLLTFYTVFLTQYVFAS
jgi:hypothetical protein